MTVSKERRSTYHNELTAFFCKNKLVKTHCLPLYDCSFTRMLLNYSLSKERAKVKEKSRETNEWNEGNATAVFKIFNLFLKYFCI